MIRNRKKINKISGLWASLSYNSVGGYLLRNIHKSRDEAESEPPAEVPENCLYSTNFVAPIENNITAGKKYYAVYNKGKLPTVHLFASKNTAEAGEGSSSQTSFYVGGPFSID